MDSQMAELLLPGSRTDRGTTAEGKFVEVGPCGRHINRALISANRSYVNEIPNVPEPVFQVLMETVGDGNGSVIESRPDVFGIILPVEDILRAFEQHGE
ncbi:hypothetical protein EXE45_16975 [Halorubrum sp. SP9]|nr:hypothetical protein EXE45_16975 [Halorubrum sp. SP9]